MAFVPRAFTAAASSPTMMARLVLKPAASHPHRISAGRTAIARRGRCQGAANDALTQIKEEGNRGTAEQYSAAIAEMSASGEWMSCVELLSEAKLLGLSLDQEALENAAIVLSGAEVDQGAKAADVLSSHLKAGGSVSLQTLCLVMRCLAAKPDCKNAAKLMELAVPEASQEYAEPLNCLLRSYARADEIDEAKALFLKLFNSDLVLGDSYTAMAAMYVRAGDCENADMMLELRG